MSADNGIYIARFPRAGVKFPLDTWDHKVPSEERISEPHPYEYRVIHAQNIEDCGDDDIAVAHYGKGIAWNDTDWMDARRFRFFGAYENNEVEVFLEEDKANVFAHKMAGDFSVLEYGVCYLEFKRPLPSITIAEATRRCDMYYKKWLKEQRRLRRAQPMR